MDGYFMYLFSPFVAIFLRINGEYEAETRGCGGAGGVRGAGRGGGRRWFGGRLALEVGAGGLAGEEDGGCSEEEGEG